MKFTKFAASLISLALLMQNTAVFPVNAIDIPNAVYDGTGGVEISGSVSVAFSGSFISIKLADGGGNIGYIGQTAVKPDGSYVHKFSFDGKISDYKLSVNLGGNLINDSVVSAIYTPERLSVNLSLMQNRSIAEATAQVTDYFGLYTGGINYRLILAMYDIGGKLVSAISTEDNSNKNSAALLENVIPSEAVTCKAFVWSNDGVMVPLTGAEKITVGSNIDTKNQAGNEWKAINMRTAEMKANGITGGEGGQRIMSLAVSEDDSLLLCGNDTGGINRSTDGGKTWEDCVRGFYSGGATAIAIDPMNKNRVLAAGSSQNTINDKAGVYLSDNAGFSWRQTLSQPGSATTFDLRESLCYDRTSYLEDIGGSAVAYWSRLWRLQLTGGVPIDEADVKISDTDQKGLWKTTDGGETWSVVNSDMSDGVVKVNPKDGTVYVGNLDGFHRSTDGGHTFTTVMDGGICLGVDAVNTPGYEDYVWITMNDGLYVSTDAGQSFTKIDSASFPKSKNLQDTDKLVRNLKVSPINPQHMVVGSFDGSNYRNAKYYSRDGGETWIVSSYNEDKDFFKVNNRHPVFVWSNLADDKLWSIGGDWIASSYNGGREYEWDYNGGGEVFVDQRTIFNVYNPDIFYYGSQDFHGALTTDGGDTWKHIWKLSGHYAGYVYGSYAADEKTLIAIVEDVVTETGKRTVQVSRDAGETWTDTGCEVYGRGVCKWSEICYQSPTDPNVLFAADWRSDDYGYTWTKMKNVHSVNAHNFYGDKELYGTYYNKIMVSYDSGATWKEYAKVLSDETVSNTQIWDIAYDGINNIMYYVSGNRSGGRYFCKVQNGVTTDLTGNLNRDGENGVSIQLCAVDPNCPQVVYVGGYKGGYISQNGAQRSTDGGKTFYTLTTNTTNSIVKTGIAGGIEPYDLIVHPVTGELWVPQNCNGWVKFPAPYTN